MKEINLAMKPVCECGYVFDNLVLKRIRPKFIPNALASQFYACEFDPPACANCGKIFNSQKNLSLYRKGGQSI